MVKTTMEDDELAKKINNWAKRFNAICRSSYPKAYIGVDLDDMKQMLWEPGLGAKAKYEELPDEKKIHSMCSYINKACSNWLFNYRTRKLHPTESAIATAIESMPEGEIDRLAEREFDSNGLIGNIYRFKFKNIRQAMQWYAVYLTTDRRPTSKKQKLHSFDDEMCVAVDISNIFDRGFIDEEKLLLLQIGMDGYKATLGRMKTPVVGNNKRYLNALENKLKEHLIEAGYLHISQNQERAAA